MENDYNPSREASDEQLEEIKAQTIVLLREAKIPPEFIHAYEQTGLIITERTRKLYTSKVLKKWDHAVDEYRRLHRSEHDANTENRTGS